MQRLLLLVGLAWAGVASAATPVVLPPGEPAANWTDALALAGLAAGPAGDGAWIELQDRGETWHVRVRDAAGKVQELNVPEPKTASEREDLVWLVRSLLQPASGRSSWADVSALPKPPPAAKPTSTAKPAAAPAPKPVAAPAPKKPAPPPPRPAPVAQPEPPAPDPVWAGAPTPAPAPPASATPWPAPVAEASAPPPPASPAPASPAPATLDRPRRYSPWAAAGATVGVRPDAAVAPAVVAMGGLAIGPSARVGLVGAWTPARALPELGDDRWVEAVDILGQAGWRFPVRFSPTASVVAGVSARRFLQDDAGVVTGAVPLLGVGMSASIPIGGALSLSPTASATADLRAVQVRVGNASAGALSPWEVRAGAVVSFDPPHKD